MRSNSTSYHPKEREAGDVEEPMMATTAFGLLLVARVWLLSRILKEISSIKSSLERMREDIKDLKPPPSKTDLKL